jgi:hypothetical protein
VVDEYTPPWEEDPAMDVPPGTYFWPIHVWSVELPAPDAPKPYVNVFYAVVGGPQDGYKNSFRLYITPAAKNWALWFLRKFGYPEELLGDKPIIRKAALIDLTGKIQVEVYRDEYGPRFDVKGFERLTETELEDRLKAKEEQALPFKEEEPVIDINADLKEPEADLSFMDRADDGAYVATDADLPDMFFDESLGDA